MNLSFITRRAGLMLFSLPLGALILGADCTIALPGFGGGPAGDEFVTVELINETAYPVDPGLFIEDEFIDNDLLGSDLIRSADIECFSGDLLGVDPILFFAEDDGVASINVPTLEEGFEYDCGDIITFYLRQNSAGTFYVNTTVNDFSIDDFVIVELVNETGNPVDPGLFVEDVFVDTDPIDPATQRIDEVDCFPGDLIGVDPLLLLSADDELASINVPELIEGVDYFCGDVVTFFFTLDDEGVFFVDVAVNDVLLTP